MVMVMSLLIFITILVILLATASFLISSKLKQEREKHSVFECGLDLLSNLRLPFSLNFFFISIIFLISDVELVLILSFIFNMSSISLKLSSIILMGFFLVLVVGYLYEWLNGLLNWMV